MKNVYIVQSEYGEKKFYKIERMRDFVAQFVPRWQHKLRVYRKRNGMMYVGKFVDNKKIVVFN